MSGRPLWFDGCIVGAVFTAILLSASAHVGSGLFLVNLIAVGCFVAPLVAAVREGGPHGEPHRDA